VEKGKIHLWWKRVWWKRERCTFGGNGHRPLERAPGLPHRLDPPPSNPALGVEHVSNVRSKF